jgi:predicted ester cyclase
MQKLIIEDGGDDIVAGRTEWSGKSILSGITQGVHTKEFMGIAPTNKRVAVRMATFDRVVNGQIVSSEVIMDTASLLEQLGVIDPPKGF